MRRERFKCRSAAGLRPALLPDALREQRGRVVPGE